MCSLEISLLKTYFIESKYLWQETKPSAVHSADKQESTVAFYPLSDL